MDHCQATVGAQETESRQRPGIRLDPGISCLSHDCYYHGCGQATSRVSILYFSCKNLCRDQIALLYCIRTVVMRAVPQNREDIGASLGALLSELPTVYGRISSSVEPSPSAGAVTCF